MDEKLYLTVYMDVNTYLGPDFDISFADLCS